jgi:hypothetical protein
MENAKTRMESQLALATLDMRKIIVVLALCQLTISVTDVHLVRTETVKRKMANQCVSVMVDM